VFNAVPGTCREPFARFSLLTICLLEACQSFRAASIEIVSGVGVGMAARFKRQVINLGQLPGLNDGFAIKGEGGVQHAKAQVAERGIASLEGYIIVAADLHLNVAKI
jgi:hypothetical protein